jgi:hypothetical protein
MLGLVTDKDTDAAGNTPQEKPKQKTKWLNPGTDDWKRLLKKAEADGLSYDQAMSLVEKGAYSTSKETRDMLQKIIEDGLV